MGLEILNILNTREQALLIWIGVAMAFFLYREDTRGSILGVLEAFFVRPILLSLLIMVTYVVSSTYLIYLAGFWTAALIKTTVLWAASVATSLMFRVASVDNEKVFFKDELMDLLKFTVFVEFIVSSYSFSIFLEIILVPVSVILVGLDTYAGFKDEYRQVKRITGFILGVLGAAVVFAAISKAFENATSFVSSLTVHEFLLAPVLTILFMPFLYVLLTYLRYDSAFSTLSFLVGDKEVEKYTKKRVLFAFGLNLSMLKHWRSALNHVDRWTKADIDKSIEMIKFAHWRERHPSRVAVTNGWSPIFATQFLSDCGLLTGWYGPDFDDVRWEATTPPRELNEDILADKITYRVSGNKWSATELRLRLFGYGERPSEDSLGIWQTFANLLYERSVQFPMSDELAYAIQHGTFCELEVRYHKVSVKYQHWSMGRGTYEVDFLVRSQAHKEGPY